MAKEVAVRTAASRTVHRVRGINHKETGTNHRAIAIVLLKLKGIRADHHKERIAISRRKVKTATGSRKEIAISLKETESLSKAIALRRETGTVLPREINPKVTNHL